MFCTRQFALRPDRPAFVRPGGIQRSPLRIMTRGLFLAACLLFVLAGPALAATSQTCLRRCLTACAEQGRGRDEACLRPCLKDCPVHCGTVDTDCALDCVRGSSGDSGKRTSERGEDKTPDPLMYDRTDTAARCAEACTVKPVCLPSAYDSGPAELRPLAPHSRQGAAPRAAPAPAQSSTQAASQREKHFEPKGRSFSLAAPQGWTVQEQDNLPKGGDYELLLLAKGAALLDYAQISVRYVPGPHRTAERFLHDLEHPVHAAASVLPPALSKASLSGQSPELAAWRVESHGVRTLIGHDDSVPVLKRTLLLPQASGYFVLALETPEATAEANSPVFERLAQSFRPQLKARPRGPELSAHERAVWAGFFRSGGKIEQADQKDAEPNQAAGEVPPPPARPGSRSGLEQPMQYLADTAKTRLAHGRTLAAPTLHKDALAEFLLGCGAQGLDKTLPALAQAWDAVRGQQVLVADNIFLPGPGEYGLDVLEEPARPGAAPPGDAPAALGQERQGGPKSQELMPDPARQGRLRPPTDPSSTLALHGGVVTLSRVAFSPEGDLALAYVAHGRTSPGTSHFVLLRRTPRGWVLCGAAQRDMIIF